MVAEIKESGVRFSARRFELDLEVGNRILWCSGILVGTLCVVLINTMALYTAPSRDMFVYCAIVTPLAIVIGMLLFAWQAQKLQFARTRRRIIAEPTFRSAFWFHQFWRWYKTGRNGTHDFFLQARLSPLEQQRGQALKLVFLFGCLAIGVTTVLAMIVYHVFEYWPDLSGNLKFWLFLLCLVSPLIFTLVWSVCHLIKNVFEASQINGRINLIRQQTTRSRLAAD